MFTYPVGGTIAASLAGEMTVCAPDVPGLRERAGAHLVALSQLAPGLPLALDHPEQNRSSL